MRLLSLILFASFLQMPLTQYSAQAESAISIEFVAPTFSDDSLAYPESSFSSPASFIVFDPVVFGDPDDFENKTVLQLLEEDTVFRDSGPDLTVPVEKLERDEYATIEPNELIDIVKNYPETYRHEMPFPFVGRFETEVIEEVLGGGINSHGVTVTNAASRTYGAARLAPAGHLSQATRWGDKCGSGR